MSHPTVIATGLEFYSFGLWISNFKLLTFRLQALSFRLHTYLILSGDSIPPLRLSNITSHDPHWTNDEGETSNDFPANSKGCMKVIRYN